MSRVPITSEKESRKGSIVLFVCGLSASNIVLIALLFSKPIKNKDKNIKLVFLR